MTKHLEEQMVESAVAYQGSFMQLHRDVVRLPNGQHAVREFVRHPGAALVVPFLPDGQVVLERQFRYPLKQAFIEFPAGKLDAGEPPLQCAARELTEETGYTAQQFAYAGAIHNAIGYSDEVIHVFFARELSQGVRTLDDTEFLDVFTAPLAWLMSEIQAGRVTDAKTVTAALWAEKHLRGEWPCQWRAAPSDTITP
jgi:ADP-ribose pyrophosphatase